MVRIERQATTEELRLVHNESYIRSVADTAEVGRACAYSDSHSTLFFQSTAAGIHLSPLHLTLLILVEMFVGIPAQARG